MSAPTPPPTSPQQAKPRARSHLRTSLAALSTAQTAHFSDQIVVRLKALREYAAARTILMFVPMAHLPEVDLRPLIAAALAAGKVVALPRTDWAHRELSPRQVTDLAADLEPDVGAPTATGLLHPRATCPAVNTSDIDLMLIPGLGFDEAGGRIGHGAGFYDRFLAQVAGALICGVGFEAQVLPTGQFLPREQHDRMLDALLTETREIRFPGNARRGAG